MDKLFKELMPETAQAFETLMNATFKDSALPLKVKEFIAIGVAVSMGCEDCMNHHIAIAKDLGATKAELADAMAVGFEMGAGRLYPPLVRTLSQNLAE